MKVKSKIGIKLKEAGKYYLDEVFKFVTHFLPKV